MTFLFPGWDMLVPWRVWFNVLLTNMSLFFIHPFLRTFYLILTYKPAPFVFCRRILVTRVTHQGFTRVQLTHLQGGARGIISFLVLSGPPSLKGGPRIGKGHQQRPHFFVHWRCSPVFQRRWTLTFVSFFSIVAASYTFKNYPAYTKCWTEQPYLTIEWKKATADLVETKHLLNILILNIQNIPKISTDT